jgi:DNA-binding MarR family transcriptional regulator
MVEVSNAAMQRLLLLMAEYGHVVNAALADVTADPELVNNVTIVVLCTLDLDGPRRPGVLQEVTGLSSGGVSKLLDRMEQAGVVKRTYGGVPGDNRGVLVSITRRGRTLAGKFAGAMAGRLPEPRAIVKDVAAALEV